MVLLVVATIALTSLIVLPSSWYLLRQARTQEAKASLQGAIIAAQQDPRNKPSSPEFIPDGGWLWSLSPAKVSGFWLIPMNDAGATGAENWTSVNEAPPETCVPLVDLGLPVETSLGTLTTATCQGRELFVQQFSVGEGPSRRTYSVVATADHNDSNRLFGLLCVVLAAAGIVVVTMASVLSRPLANRALQPVREASRVATAIADGDMSRRLTVHGDDELATMSLRFNAMTDALTDTIAQLTTMEASQRQFVSDVSHELRTPAATLVATADSLEDPATRDEAATMIAPQLRRLSALVEDLLEIARMDAGRAAMTWDEVPLGELIRAVVRTEGLDDATTVTGDVTQPVLCDPRRVSVVMRNLLANARIHGEPPITIMVGSTAGLVTITVKDAGPGLPRDFVDRAFNRFSQGDHSRHRGGTGLGLALARENARLHRIQNSAGDLVWDATEECFVLTLPQPAR